MLNDILAVGVAGTVGVVIATILGSVELLRKVRRCCSYERVLMAIDRSDVRAGPWRAGSARRPAQYGAETLSALSVSQAESDARVASGRSHAPTTAFRD